MDYLFFQKYSMIKLFQVLDRNIASKSSRAPAWWLQAYKYLRMPTDYIRGL